MRVSVCGCVISTSRVIKREREGHETSRVLKIEFVEKVCACCLYACVHACGCVFVRACVCVACL